MVPAFVTRVLAPSDFRWEDTEAVGELPFNAPAIGSGGGEVRLNDITDLAECRYSAVF